MGRGFDGSSSLKLTTCGFATKITIQGSVGTFAFETGMFERTAHTVTTPMVNKTKTSWYSKIGARLSNRGAGWWFSCGALRSEPQLPVDCTPGKRSSRGLPEKPKIFIIESPVVAPGSQILNCGTVFHKARGLIGIASSIHPHKNMKSLDPSVDRDNFLWLMYWL